MAEVMMMSLETLKRWMARDQKTPEAPAAKQGRPEAILSRARWKLRECYLEHHRQWGPRVLACWAEREHLGSWSPSTIAKAIADLREPKPPRKRPVRYEVTEPGAMWSEDGTGFGKRGHKQELLVAQDECSRFKVSRRLVPGPATDDDVVAYLREAFERFGAPLVIKRDRGSIFQSEKVARLLDEYGVLALTGPRSYPQYNAKMERSMRDYKSYERALRRDQLHTTLAQRIDAAHRDLNYLRPRPMLGGQTAWERFLPGPSRPLPDRKQLKREVNETENFLLNQARSRVERDSARRRAIERVLYRHGLLVERADMSTNSHARTGTN